jgi:hypothetical protein
MSEDLLLHFMHKAAKGHATPLIKVDFLDFMLNPKKMIVFISLNQCGMVGVGLGEFRN